MRYGNVVECMARRVKALNITVYGIGYMHITSSLLISIGVVSRHSR
jgi:hypothetical protein